MSEDKKVAQDKKPIIESERVYIYPNEFRRGEPILSVFLDITEVKTMDDGSHLVYTDDGSSHIVKPGFIRIDTKNKGE